MKHKLDWTDLQYILAVAESGSVAGAARTLGVNHTTVLRRIAAFEERHDARIFERHPGGYRLAADHAQILGRIGGIAEHVDAIARVITGETLGYGGEVRITTTDSLGASVMGRVLTGFRRAFPGVVTELTVTNSRLDLARLDADITVRPAQALPEGFAGERAAEMVFRVYRRQGDGMADETWIGPGEALSRSPVADWMARNVAPERVAFRADSFVAVAALVAGGAGRAMLPCFLGDAQPGLVRSAAIDDEVATGIWVAAHRERAQSARIRAFLSHITEAIRADAPLFAGRL